MLFQLVGQIGQSFYVGVHLAPVHLVKERLELCGVGGLVPGPPGGGVLRQIFVLQKGRPLHRPLAQKVLQVGPHAAFGRVDLQPGEDGQQLRLLPATLSLLLVGVLVVGDDAAIQRGIADLPHPGGEGVPYHLESGLPVMGGADPGLRRRDHQQGNILPILQ